MDCSLCAVRMYAADMLKLWSSRARRQEDKLEGVLHCWLPVAFAPWCISTQCSCNRPFSLPGIRLSFEMNKVTGRCIVSGQHYKALMKIYDGCTELECRFTQLVERLAFRSICMMSGICGEKCMRTETIHRGALLGSGKHVLLLGHSKGAVDG